MPPSQGTIAFRARANWASEDPAGHVFFIYETTGTGEPSLQVSQGGNLIALGWHTGGVDARKYIADPPFSSVGLITSGGDFVNWLLEWDAAVPYTRLYRDAVPIGASVIAFTPPATFDQLTIGNNAAGTATFNGDVCEWMLLNYILTAEQKADLSRKGVASLPTPPIHYVKILGIVSPEVADIGGDLVLVGTPAFTAHPVFADLGSPPALVKTAPQAPVVMSHVLAEGLLMAWHFGEGAGVPRERVADVAPAVVDGSLPEVDGASFAWDVDGAFHFRDGALEYPTTVLDGLEALTILLLMQNDTGTYNDPAMEFPNQPESSIIAKQLQSPWAGGAPGASPRPGAACAFMIGIQQADETDISVGGRSEFWCIIGALESWYLFRVNRLPWATRYQQVLFTYDRNRALLDRWRCRVDGIVIPPCGRYADGNPVVPTTAAPLVLGASTATPPARVGINHGGLQAAYIWAGARDNIWVPLIDNPYAPFQLIKAIDGVPVVSVKKINAVTATLRKRWDGLA